ncbi:hypothetical protein FC756_22840 [Lysinibacillus mangiferihumi]|uniref:Uncharacterized protein n=1 Tax=Lysinibacillus mangiferihumi TaxID=1130819 RepID=A0A4U2Y1G9_9BACI|nr:hypothetical protein FC756_22840 [Lysinibacillus mangiferihumi]
MHSCFLHKGILFMLISTIIRWGFILGSLLVLRMMQIRKRRVEKKKVLADRLEHLLLTNP